MKRAPQIRALLDGEIFADCFAGGGGTSTGIEAALGRSPDIAINHDPEAIAMHRANHPDTHHYCESIHDVDPAKACAGRRCGFAWFSPDCTFHSKARGGKPHRDRNRARRIRGLAWVAVRWAKAVRPRVIFVENVEELKDWGPLGDDGRPDPERKGQTFARWVAMLRNLGYAVEWRELRACDFGAPTSRNRLFVIARCDGKPIRWPAPTHGPRRARPYRTAAECIDWSLPVPSIFMSREEARAWGKASGQESPKRPLADATLRRIARGIYRFVIDSPQPFIVSNLTNNVPRPVDEPLSTLLTGNHKYVVTPYLANVRHRDDSRREYSLFEPVRTIPASDREVALIAPTLIQTGYGERDGQAPRSLDLHEPLGTVVAGGIKHSLVAAFLAKHNGGHEATGQRVLEPTHAITTRDQKALVTSHLMKFQQNGAGLDVRQPIDTVMAGATRFAEVRAFLVKFYGTATATNATLPLDTITTRDRFGLITVTIDGEEYVIADIGMRMLTPRELFRAQGFPDDYVIEEVDGRPLTKKAQTRMVGNSVPPPAAAALVAANMGAAA